MKPMSTSSSSAQVHSGEIWTTRRLLKWMSDHFQSKAIDSPRVVAEMLLAHVLGCERLRLYMESDRPASSAELAQLRELVARAAKHEPVQYLVGHAWFFGRQFAVSRATLIPRPCTETLVEHVLQWHRVQPGHVSPLIADIGTGTGCIAISLAAQIPDARVIATDIVPDALELARANAALHKVQDRMEFRLGSLLAPVSVDSPVPGERFDVICSNPPYIPDHEWERDVDRNVKEFEPQSALRGGADGLEFIRPLIAGAAPLLKPGGLLAIEIADCQRDAALALAKQSEKLSGADVLKDHEGLWRTLVAERVE
jgi:release factor glutamine methyltransferase